MSEASPEAKGLNFATKASLPPAFTVWKAFLVGKVLEEAVPVM
jgi:hypothetical protein